MWVDDIVPHEMPALYVREIREYRSHNEGEKTVAIQATQDDLVEEKAIKRETFILGGIIMFHINATDKSTHRV